jgi:cell pole-organizing protein PopZ
MRYSRSHATMVRVASDSRFPANHEGLVRKRDRNAAMSQAAKAQEPSMEEILASIRRIIADDDVSRTAAPVAEAPRPAPPPARPAAVAPPPPEPAPVFQAPVFEPEPEPAPVETDILDLTEEMQTPEEPVSFRTIDAQPDVIFTEGSNGMGRDGLDTDHLEAARQQLAASMGESLLSSTTAASVDSAFNALAQTVLVQNARTIEDLVKDMLRPMLKTWLDDNLPGLVERLVRAEIERVSRGRTPS